MKIRPLRSIHIVFTITLVVGLTSCSLGEAQQSKKPDQPSQDQQNINSSHGLKIDEALQRLYTARKTQNWSYDTRWYHVDIPRFSNGDRSNDPKGTLPWAADWPLYQGSYQIPRDDDFEKRKEKLSQWYQSARKEVASREYGGDLQGLMGRLPYIKSLGVNTLYLGRIFSPTHYSEDGRHQFHYHHVDDSIGVKNSAKQITGETTNPATWKFSATDQLLIKFIQTAHHQGIRVVISSYDFITANHNDPMSPEIKQLMAVTRRWMDPNGDGDPSDGVDGWVPGFDLITMDDLRIKWRSKVKEINPNCLIFEDEPPASMKSIRNHHAIQEFITYDLQDKLSKKANQQSHQKERFNLITKFAEQLHIADVNQDFHRTRQRKLTDMDLPGSLPSFDGKPTAGAYDRWKLATIMQHFLPGVPITYYGDEVGMYGGPTPENARRPMWWNDLPDPKTESPDYRGDFFALVKWLHEMRATYAPLRRGDFRSMMADDEKKIFAFARSYKGEEVILLMNVGKEKQMAMLSAGEPGQIVATLSPQLSPRPARGSKTVDYTKIKTMHVGGVRQFVNKEGKIRIWVNPMSVRVVIVNQE